jgi:hypothetical protein
MDVICGDLLGAWAAQLLAGDGELSRVLDPDLSAHDLQLWLRLTPALVASA